MAAAALALGLGVTGPMVLAAAPAGATARPGAAAPRADAAPTITSTAAATLTAGTSGSFTVTTSGTPAPTITESGAVPAGVTFHDNGNGTATISGTPTTTTGGTSTLTITATNGVGSAAVQQLVLTVDAAPRVTSPAAASLKPGVDNDIDLTATGTPTPSLAESGTLPPGLAFQVHANGTATISGTPPANASGSYGVTITASNGIGAAAVQHLVLTFSGAPQFSSASTLAVSTGNQVDFTVTTTGAPAPRLTLVGGLPPGLSFHDNGNGTGTVSGVPSSGDRGSYDATFVASNGVGSPARQTLVITAQLGIVPGGVGYWYATSAGEILFKGEARPIAPKTPQNPRHIGTMTTTPSDQGYYLVASFGGLFNYGDARFYGSIAHLHLRTPTVAFAVTADDGGYYEVTRAGNVFAYGNARFYGSMAGHRIPPVVAFGIMPHDSGYWLVTTQGNVYRFGQAAFYGSVAARHVRTAPVTAFSPTPDGHGYWLVTRTGEVLAFGDAGYYGQVGGHPVPPVVAFAPTADGHGYWLVTSSGNVYQRGDARFYGSSAHTRLAGTVVGFGVDF